MCTAEPIDFLTFGEWYNGMLRLEFVGKFLPAIGVMAAISG